MVISILPKEQQNFLMKFISVFQIICIKIHYFSHEERVDMIEECTHQIDNVYVHSNPKNLVIRFAKEHDAVAIIRGLRHVSDFELEFQMAMVNHGINSEISTILMVSNEKFLHLNSTIIKELAKYDTDLSKFVPKSIENILIKKMKENNG